MTLVKILKRKDASSVLVAIALALIVSQTLPQVTGELAAIISGVNQDQYRFGGEGTDWQQMYLNPVVWAMLQVIALEILAWIVIFVGSVLRPVSKKK